MVFCQAVPVLRVEIVQFIRRLNVSPPLPLSLSHSSYRSALPLPLVCSHHVVALPAVLTLTLSRSVPLVNFLSCLLRLSFTFSLARSPPCLLSISLILLLICFPSRSISLIALPLARSLFLSLTLTSTRSLSCSLPLSRLSVYLVLAPRIFTDRTYILY